MASPTSTTQATLEALEALAESLAVSVCYEPMAGAVTGTGGLCRVRGEYRVIIDRRLPARERIQILSTALARFDLSDIELPELVRPLFEPPALAG